jgi:hypothetical protein
VEKYCCYWMKAEICTGAGVCTSWGVQVCAFKLGVQVGAFCEFLVSNL